MKVGHPARPGLPGLGRVAPGCPGSGPGRRAPSHEAGGTVAVLSFLRPLAQPGGRMVLLVMDGLGGLPHPESGLTELESARTPHLDALAAQGSCGLSVPVAWGVTPGSGPGHLGLFGYDPQEYRVGRGVLSALGVGVELGPGDVAARANFATRDGRIITDRRAGRIPTEECRRLCELVQREAGQIGDVRVRVYPEMQYRAVVVFSGPDLDPRVTDSDPQATGVAALDVEARVPEAAKMARTANEFLRRAWKALEGQRPANALLLRGFDRRPDFPGLGELFGLRAAAVAHYPMYRGLARLVGMEAFDAGPEVADAVRRALELWDRYDFLFIHIKGTDSAGEDGDWERKRRVIEAVDAALPHIVDRQPDVLVVTGDHSTPAALRSHSWHPVPLLLWARTARRDSWIRKFGESECARGSLGRIRSTEILPLMLAHAGRLAKYGA